jgi:threonine/homoserine efflux transporter RhtA
MADFSPATKGFAVTPSDTVNLAAGICRAIYVGVGGNVVVVHGDDTTVTYTSLAAGVVHPIMAKRINNTNTTATSIVALY